MQVVVLDTNFLLIPGQFGIDIFSELFFFLHGKYQLVVPSAVIDELSKLSGKMGKKGMAARLALKIIDVRKNEITIMKSKAPADEWIIKFAIDKKAIVCTNDKALRTKVKKAGLKVLTLKSKSKVGFA